MYNDVDGEQQGSAASDADGAMDSENLGPPRQMLERLYGQGQQLIRSPGIALLDGV